MIRQPTTRFRMRAKSIFLTYPQCDGLIINELWEFLKGGTATKAIICKELHQDGNEHVHALVSYNKPMSVTDPAAYDFHEWHPNIQAAKNPAAIINYIKKDGNYFEYGLTEESLFDKARRLGFEEYFEECRKNRITFQYAMNAWTQTKRITSTLYSNEASGEITCQKLSLCFLPASLRSLVILGAPGTGKTTRAIHLAPMPCLFVTHVDDLKQLTSSHRSIIFDDMSFAHTPREAQIAIVDREQPRSIHVRYGIASVPAGIVKIFTANHRPFEDDPAINRRIQIFLVY